MKRVRVNCILENKTNTSCEVRPTSISRVEHWRNARRPPVVSVVMPTYNGEKFLWGAIESILAQSFQDFELIVVDDGSTDRTPQILAEFADERIIVLTNERNLGIAAAT